MRQGKESNMLCPNCKNEISAEAKACPKCGQPLLGRSSPKSRTGVAVLCLLFGGLGVHRFYAGKVGSGLVQLGLSLLAGLCGVSALINMGYAAVSAAEPDKLANEILAKGLAGSGAALTLGLALGGVVLLWVLIDFFRGLCGAFQDKNKRRIDRW
jgi:TM2 domain-containing membrane protein YozV